MTKRQAQPACGRDDVAEETDEPEAMIQYGDTRMDIP